MAKCMQAHRAQQQAVFSTSPPASTNRPPTTPPVERPKPPMAARVVSGIAGAVAAGAALYILTADAVTSGTWTLDAALAPVTVGLTIMSGHLFSAAIAGRRWFSATGFAMLFVVGTVLTIYGSVGRQAEATSTTALAAESIRLQRAGVMASLTRNQSMLAEAQKKLGTECATGDGPACKGIKATINVYGDAITGNLAQLKAIGPERATNGAAARLAEIVGMVGGDGERAMKLAVMLEPFCRTLLLELGAVVCFGFAFSGGHGCRNSPSMSAAASITIPTPIGPTAGRTIPAALRHQVIHRVTPPGNVSVNASPSASAMDAVYAWVLCLGLGECVTIRQRELAARLGLSQPHVSRCLNALKSAGRITMLSGQTGTVVSRRAGIEDTGGSTT
jgi:Crp-like helix-turn-helix domain